MSKLSGNGVLAAGMPTLMLHAACCMYWTGVEPGSTSSRRSERPAASMVALDLAASASPGAMPMANGLPFSTCNSQDHDSYVEELHSFW